MTEPTTKFYKKVDRRSRRAMAEFLALHFRYHTANSWNQASSYANNVKIHKVVPYDLQDKVSEALDVDHYDCLNQLLRDWDVANDYRWQAGFNGRSGGYIVMYQGGWRPSQHKRLCTACGQKNFQAETTKCGRCGRTTTMVDYSGRDTFTYPGRGTDHECELSDFMDPEEWTMSDLRARVELVQSFDQLCDDVVAEAIYMAENYDVVEEEIEVTRIIKVLEPK